MQPSIQPSIRSGFHELVMEALISRPQPVARPSDADLEIDIVWDDEEPADEVAVTHRFVRFSAPYERVEIEPLPSGLASPRRARHTSFVRTVPAQPSSPSRPSVTLAFDKMWFDQPEDASATIEDMPVSRATSWRWLGISILVAAVAVGLAQYLL